MPSLLTEALNATRTVARERAGMQPGRFVGVVLAKPAPAEPDGKATWNAFTLPTQVALADWYNDWSSSPGLFHYVAAYDRSTSNDPIAEADDQTERVRMSGSATPSLPSLFDRIEQIVANHETYWSHIVELHPQSELARWWLIDRWGPFYTDWVDLVSHHGLSDADADVLAAQLAKINALRAEAVRSEIPLPDGGPVTIVSGHGHGGGGHGGGHGHGGRYRRGRYGRGWGGGWGWGWPYYYDDDNDDDDEDDDDQDDDVIVQGAPMHSQPYRFERGERFRGGVEYAADPGVGGITFSSFALDGDTLHATICIDGRCYSGSIDLSSLLAAVGDRFAAYHAGLHGSGGDVAEVVQGAGDVLVGTLVGQHYAICGGWWHSLTHSISSAVNGVGHVASEIGTGAAHTLKALKGPISIAAAGAATAFVGPQAGPIAAELTGSLIDAANGDASAQQVVAQATQAAQANPVVAQALQGAQQAVTQTTAAYHTVQTVAAAAQGNKAAQQQVQQLATAATSGDPAAQQLLGVAQQVVNSDDGGDSGDGGAADAVSSGWFLPALFAGTLGYAGGHFGVLGRGYDWARARFEHHE